MQEKNILIVEDNEALQESMQIYLGTRNFRIVQARSVDQALQLLQKETPDVILLDLLLPEKNGIVLLESLQEKKSSIPVIVITNMETTDMREHCLQAGARDVLIKSNTSLPSLTQLIMRYCGNG